MASFSFDGAQPKGLKNFRGIEHPRLANPLTTTIADNSNIVISQEHILSGNVSDSSSISSKPRRTDSSSPLEELRVTPVYWDYSHICSTHPDKYKMGAKFMDTSAIVGPGQAAATNTASFSLEDWKDLRDLAIEAKNTYDRDLSGAIDILRAVIHECHRCLKFHPDPSVLFAAPLHKKKVEPVRPPPVPPLPIHEWYNDPQDSASRRRKPMVLLPPASQVAETEECPCVDLPTAFHTVLGTALFTFGCIIDADSSLALEGEPKKPTPYWLAAIDVFESGDSLPIRTSGRVPKTMPEDWRMSASWGRTLIKLAAELLKRRKENPALREPPPVPDYRNFKVPPPSLPTPFKTYTADEPNWPRESIFATISFLRPPFTRRLSLDTLSPDEIMTFAEDHLCRAVFHMPHPRNVIPARYPYHPSAPMQVPPPPPPVLDFETDRNGPDRPQEIYTIASEMLFVAENSETPSGRLRWARWAEGVIGRVTIEPSMKPYKFVDLRARCNLTMGTAKMEELMADRDYPNVLHTDDAEDGREYFQNAATFFEQVMTLIEADMTGKQRMDFDNDDGEGGSGKSSEPVYNESSLLRMKGLRSEALIELGKLTADSTAREELYAEARRVGEGIYDQMDETE